MIFPPDIDAAYESWGANCGPCSIAALLGKTVEEVRPFLEGFEQRPYMNITHLKNALTAAGVQFQSIGKRRPQHGLVFVQWGGHEKRPVFVQYQYTHTITVDGDTVFEVNAPELTTWALWEKVMPHFMLEEKQGNGTYFIRGALEVIRR